MDYEELFELFNSREKVSDDCNLTKETIYQLSPCIDSAWDRKVAKHVLVSTRSRTQHENLGIGNRISKALGEASKGISERQKYIYHTSKHRRKHKGEHKC